MLLMFRKVSDVLCILLKNTVALVVRELTIDDTMPKLTVFSQDSFRAVCLRNGTFQQKG